MFAHLALHFSQRLLRLKAERRREGAGDEACGKVASVLPADVIMANRLVFKWVNVLFVFSLVNLIEFDPIYRCGIAKQAAECA